MSMTAVPTRVCAVPGVCWEQRTQATEDFRELAELIHEIETSGRRLGKKVNPAQENVRYTAALARLDRWLLANGVEESDPAEATRIVKSGRVAMLNVDADYFRLLHAAHKVGEPFGVQSGNRLGARVIHPDRLASNLKGIEGLLKRARPQELPAAVKRQQFVRICRRWAGCGLVEIPVLKEKVACGDLELPVLKTWRQRVIEWFLGLFRLNAEQDANSVTEPGSDDSEHEPEYGATSNNRGELIRNAFVSQIRGGLKGTGAVFVGNQRHPTITDALAQFVTQRKRSGPATDVRLVHSDGSDGGTIPLNAIEPYAADWRPTRELHVGLMSMRHLALDREVNMYWFRNLEIPRRGSNAEAAEYCYTQSIAMWKRLREYFAGERLQIFMYHTGFVPAILGFYQALATTLVNEQATSRVNVSGIKRDWLRVIPIFKPSNDPDRPLSEHGCPWPATQRELQSWTLESWLSDGKPPASIATL